MEQLDFKIFEIFIGKYPGNFSDLLFFLIQYIKSIKQIQLQYLRKKNWQTCYPFKIVLSVNIQEISQTYFFFIQYIKSIKQIQLQYSEKKIGKHVILLKLFLIHIYSHFIYLNILQPIALSTYVMVTEFFPSTVRTYPSVAVNCSWSVGILILAVFGYFIRDWHTLQLVITIPNLLTIFFFW